MKIITFGYRKRPVPVADHVMDVRNIPNPHQDFKRMGVKDGRDMFAQGYLMRDIKSLVLPADVLLDKDSTIAIGCDWGKHRSVAVAEVLAKNLRMRGWHVEVQHLELGDNK